MDFYIAEEFYKEFYKEVFVSDNREGHRAELAALLLDDALQVILGKSAKLVTVGLTPNKVKVYFDHPAGVSFQQLRAIEIAANQAIIAGLPSWFIGSVGSICITDEGQLGVSNRRWIVAYTGEKAVETNQRARETLQKVADVLGVKCQDVPERVELMAAESTEVAKVLKVMPGGVLERVKAVMAKVDLVQRTCDALLTKWESQDG